MATIFIDDQRYEVDERQNLLATSLSLGFNLPYFCWHPAMGSVGACRQCAVKQFKDAQDRDGRLVMACMTPAKDGSRISIEDPEAKAFRASVIEWLMANHPHDCPVCDEGGECHLQDMTVMTGHAYRRYRFPKRTYRNQYLGPFIKHDMNRCIQCYRCVRFYRDYAGGRDFNVFSSHDTVYFGRAHDGVLENEFSGNLVEVCPTGVFNDNTLFHHYVRKWDLQSAQSICPHCSTGCNTTPGERYGVLRRVVNRFNSRVNGYFLCDLGRYGYEYVNHESRIRRPQLRATLPDPLRPADRSEAISYTVHLLNQAQCVIGIGSPRASIESNIALRSLVGAERFYLGVDDDQRHLLDTMLSIMRDGPVPSASLADVEASDGVLVLGEDLLNTAPRLALALLQSLRQEPLAQAEASHIPRWDDAAVRTVIQDRKGPLFLATHRRTWLDEVATESLIVPPEDSARLGFAVAREIDPDAPPVDDLSESARATAARVAEALLRVNRPLVVAGTGARSVGTIHAAAQVAWALKRRGKDVCLSFVAPECNSLGLVMIGGGSLSDAVQSVRQGRADTAIVLENNLFERESLETVSGFLAPLKRLIVLEASATQLTDLAHAVLPAATTAEADGTFVNAEGRAQRHFQVFVPEGDVAGSWRWLREIARGLEKAESPSVTAGVRDLASWRDLDDAVSATGRAIPALVRISEAAPSARFRVIGQKIPRQPERFSGRTAMLAHLTVHEPPPPPDPDTPLAFSMEGARPDRLPSPLIPQVWEPGWHSNQALNKYQQEVGGPLRDEWPGIRLIEPDSAADSRWFRDIPSAYRGQADRWRLFQLAHIFGTEELSRRAPAIAERTPAPYLLLAVGDAKNLHLEDGTPVELRLNGNVHTLTVNTDPRMMAGLAGLFLPGYPAALFPAWIDLRKALARHRRAA
jgi:NADH-quinone oxidoreductase subunit G